MDLLTILIFLIVVAIYAALDDDGPDEPDPLDLARPSFKRLDREAERAMAELRALDHHEREKS